MDGGLNCYNIKTKTITAYTENNGFINNTVNYITGETKGFLWLTAEKGITRLDRFSETFKNLE